MAILLPGCLDYHLALWGGEAAGIVQPLNPLLNEEKLVSLMNAGKATVLFAWGTDDIAAYFHTGGTTGAPKLARHSHGAQVFTAWVCVQLQGTLASDVVINGYPLFHVAGVLPGL